MNTKLFKYISLPWSDSIFSSLQNAVYIGCLFLAYRKAIAECGINQMGVFSLLIAFVSFSKVADVSGGTSLSRFIPLTESKGGSQSAIYFKTVVTTSLVVNITLAIALVNFIPFLLPSMIDRGQIPVASSLLPYIVAYMIIASLTIAISSTLDGLRKVRLRSVTFMFGSLVFLLSVFPLITSYGIAGLGMALVVQQTFVLILGFLIIHKLINNFGFLPIGWDRSVFKDTVPFALKLNLVGIFGLMFEPLTKMLLSVAAGTGAVAQYEVASKIVVQIRGFVVSACIPLIPRFARLSRSGSDQFLSLLRKSNKAISFLSPAVTILVLIASPLISFYVMGEFNRITAYMILSLTLGWMINLYNLPFYMACQGAGVLRWNILSHAFIAACVLIGGFISILTINSVHIILLSIVIGLFGSGFIVIFGSINYFEFHYKINKIKINNKNTIMSLIFVIIFTILANIIYMSIS